MRGMYKGTLQTGNIKRYPLPKGEMYPKKQKKEFSQKIYGIFFKRSGEFAPERKKRDISPGKGR